MTSLHKTTQRRKATRKAPSAKRIKQAKAALPAWHNYDLILLVDTASRNASVLLDRTAGTLPQPDSLYAVQPVHRQALAQACTNGLVHYEWTSGTKKTLLWQTTCVALNGPDGKVSSVLSLSRDITYQRPGSQKQYGLREWSAPKTFAQMLLAAREAEKRDISKALHDEIGSAAVILTALLSLVKANVQKGEKRQALRDIAQLDEQIKNCIERIRNIIVSLRPPMLNNRGGLAGAIRELLENVSALNGLAYSFSYRPSYDKIFLSDNVKITLYRVVQESLTNIIKHAKAKKIEVSLKPVGKTVSLIIKDDGAGFIVDEQRSVEHVGLQAMKDSIDLLGGTIKITSAPGKGSRVEVSCAQVVYGGN